MAGGSLGDVDGLVAAVANVRPDPAALAPRGGFGLVCLYTAVVLALAAWRLRRRDA